MVDTFVIYFMKKIAIQHSLAITKCLLFVYSFLVYHKSVILDEIRINTGEEFRGSNISYNNFIKLWN